MSRIIDLTTPIDYEHFRWPVERKLRGDFDKGDSFQVTWVGMAVHGFTHVDAPRHMVPGGFTTSEFDLEQLVGDTAVLDLTALGPETAITEQHLETAGQHVRAGDIILLKTGWDTVESISTPAFWTRSPYMTRPACDWLLGKKPKAVGFDFPQDYPIRGLLTGMHAPLSEFVTHDVLLRSGVILIEYLCNVTAIPAARTTVFALPLKLPDADGALARVIAWEA